MLKFTLFVKFLLPQFLMIHGSLGGKKESSETLNGIAQNEVNSMETVYLLQDSQYRTYLCLYNGEKLDLIQNIMGDYSINNLNKKSKLVEKDEDDQSYVKTIDGRKVHLKHNGRTFFIPRRNIKLLNEDAFSRYLESLKVGGDDNEKKENPKTYPGNKGNSSEILHLVHDSKYSTFLYLCNRQKVELSRNIMGEYSIDNYKEIAKMVEEDSQKRLYVKTLDGKRAYLRYDGRSYVLSSKKIERMDEETFNRYLDSLEVGSTEHNEKENLKPNQKKEVNSSGILYLVQDSSYGTFLYLHDGKKVQLMINHLGAYSSPALKKEAEMIENEGKKQYYVRTLDGKKAFLRDNGRSFELSSKNIELMNEESFEKYLNTLAVRDNE